MRDIGVDYLISANIVYVVYSRYGIRNFRDYRDALRSFVTVKRHVYNKVRNLQEICVNRQNIFKKIDVNLLKISRNTLVCNKLFGIQTAHTCLFQKITESQSFLTGLEHPVHERVDKTYRLRRSPRLAQRYPSDCCERKGRVPAMTISSSPHSAPVTGNLTPTRSSVRNRVRIVTNDRRQ